MKQIIAKYNTTSEFFGNLINNVSEFKGQEEDEPETYEVIVGFWFENKYFDLYTVNSESSRNLRIWITQENNDLISNFLETFKPNFHELREDNFNRLIFSMNGVTINSIRDYVVYEIGKISI